MIPPPTYIEIVGDICRRKINSGDGWITVQGGNYLSENYNFGEIFNLKK